MPELPEVETVRRALEKSLLGHCLIHIQCNRLDLRYPLPINFNDLVGCKIMDIKRRAKYLLLDFDNHLTLLWHLGMSGRVIIKPDDSHDIYAQQDFNKHDHVIFKSSNNLTIIYRDARRFGFMRLMTVRDLSALSFLSNIGPEPLDLQFDIMALYTKFQQHDVPIKTALLDQKIIAGIGNIYACEALWMAEISPLRRTKTLTILEVEKLLAALQDVLKRAIDYGGSTLKDHAQPNGEIGYFQNYLNVYDQQNNVCKRCRYNLIAKIKQSGRSTYYCHICQF